MPYVSLLVEMLRARPVAAFWTAALAQGVLWVLVPAVFYASPPGELPQVLAVGHEWQLGSRLGPPLAFWAAEAAFNLAGGRPLGVYLAAQACVVAAFWAVFALGTAVVGKRHAVLAVLLMTGVLSFSVPTPEFGPAVLALPLAAFTLLFYWRALAEGRRNFWIAFALALGLLLLTSAWGLLLLALMAAFTAATREGRRALASADPWAAAALALVIPFPYAVWLMRTAPDWQAEALAALGNLAGAALRWPLIVAAVVAAHAGLIALALLAGGAGTDRRAQVPEIERPDLPPLAFRFVAVFALAPALFGTLAAALLDAPVGAAWAGELVLLTGLAAIVAAGNPIRLHRQQVVGSAWFAVLLAPPLVAVLALAIVPWTIAVELSSQRPAVAMGRFFAESFQRRVGRPLEIVAGDFELASLVAVHAKPRPRVYAPASPARTPWLEDAELRRRGAILIWPIVDAVGAPPPALRARFPELVGEVPQSFSRPVQGLLPSYRVGWALIRPQAAP